jgi:hypothetical protein
MYKLKIKLGVNLGLILKNRLITPQQYAWKGNQEENRKIEKVSSPN